MDKKTLRNIYLEKRKDLSLNEKTLLENAILDHLFDNFNIEGTISSCFLPITSMSEIDTWQLITAITASKGEIALTIWDIESNNLTHRLYSNDTTIVVNPFGIPEPENGQLINIFQLDYVFVPLLIADLNGHRVGYGKGVYDRFLENCSSSTKFIGLSLFELVSSIDDINAFDIPLHACITPTKCHYFEK